MTAGRANALFAGAVALLALHALADAFLALEPGVQASDHWSAAVLPLLVLAGALAAYPRVRPGPAAALALSLAVLSAAGAGVAAAHATLEGFDVTDATGLLLAPAAAVLAWLGVAGLWRSRKPGGRRLVRRGALGLAGLAWLYYVLVPIAFAILATHRPVEDAEPPDLGREAERVTVPTADGLELSAWYAPSRNGAAVITFPSSSGAEDEARMLADRGYGVLALDMRGYGESEGDPNAFGWGSAADIDAGVAYLRSRPDVSPGGIGGIGLSVGGEQMIEAAADNEDLRAVVSEGAGERSVRETLIFGPRAALAIPQQAVLTAAVAVFSGDSPPSPLDDLAADVSPRALFLVHGERGQPAEELNRDYFEAADEPKELWEVPDAGHTGGLDAQPAEYERRVVGFFDDVLLQR